MSRKRPQLVSVYETIKKHKDIKEIKIDKTNRGEDIDENITSKEGDLISGKFIFNKIKFGFFDRCSKDFGLHRISSSFRFNIKESRVGELDEEIEKFNLYRVGLKAMYQKKSPTEVIISFNVECISNGDASVIDSHALGLYLKMLRTVPEPLLEKIKLWVE